MCLQLKYAGLNGLFFDVDGLVNPQFHQRATSLLNSSKAISTWKAAKSVLKKIWEAEPVVGDLSFPWDDYKTANFVCYLDQCGFRVSSINTYLGHLKTLHAVNGYYWQGLSDPRIKMLIKGIGNTQPVVQRPIAVTPDVLFLILQKLKAVEWPKGRKRLCWAVCLTPFCGSLRTGEALGKNSRSFHPDTSLLGRNVRKENIIVNGNSETFIFLEIESPKTGGPVTVELLGTGKWNCPVKAVTKYLASLPFAVKDDLPFFRKESGWAYSHSNFSSDIMFLLNPVLGHHRVVPHSFRAGASTALARMGESDQSLCIQGRWNSESYKRYCRKNRALLLSDQHRIMNSLAQVLQLVSLLPLH